MRILKTGAMMIAAIWSASAMAGTQKLLSVTTDHRPGNIYRIELTLDDQGNATGINYDVSKDGRIDPKEHESYSLEQFKGGGKVLLHEKFHDIIRLVLDDHFDGARGGKAYLVYIQGCSSIGSGCTYPSYQMTVDRQGSDFVVRNADYGVFNHIFMKMEDDGRNGVGSVQPSLE